MSIARAAQTARNSLQATRINAVSQVRGMFGGGFMGLADENGGGNNATPPAEGISGPFGYWNFPIINKLKGGMGGGGFGFMQQPAKAGLGTPSNVATRSGVAGTNQIERERSYGIHIF